MAKIQAVIYLYNHEQISVFIREINKLSFRF